MKIIVEKDGPSWRSKVIMDHCTAIFVHSSRVEAFRLATKFAWNQLSSRSS